jgi:hypothetical protein
MMTSTHGENKPGLELAVAPIIRAIKVVNFGIMVF